MQHFLVLLIALSIPFITTAENYTETNPYNIKNLTVGYLTAVKQLKGREGLTISGALTLALDEINNDKNILPNVTLQLRWNDTRGDTVLATSAMNDMISDGVSVFFGPEGTCYAEAILAQSKNIPMISYKCSDFNTSDIPTFARTDPPNTQVAKSVISLLKFHNWNKFSIIHEETWQIVADSLVDEAKQSNITVNDKKSATDRHTCCEEKMACCSSDYWHQLIQETKNRTRIYVFLGSPTSLIDFMNTMETAKLFDKREYTVIYVDVNPYLPQETYKYLWKPEILDKYSSCEQHPDDYFKKARSLLVVVSSPLVEDKYASFSESVRLYNSKEPFYFATPLFLQGQNYQKFVSIYAAYLYDSVKLYAKALHKLLTQYPTLTEEIIDKVASNGTKIVETIISLKSYESITGANIQLDKYGNSEGNFSVLRLEKVTNQDAIEITKGFTCDYQMVRVAQFKRIESPINTTTRTGGDGSHNALNVVD